jgi:hypothetical protein
MQRKEILALHDAEVIGVAVDRGSGSARLDLRQENGDLCFVELQGLKAFRGEDLTLQNVINRILRTSMGDISGEELEHWLTWVTSLSDADSWLQAERMREWCAACEAGSLDLVVVEPSAGAQIAALCERVILWPLPRSKC